MGNAQAKLRSAASDEPSADDAFPIFSPPTTPGSPLTYSPQVPMAPISRHNDASGHGAPTEFHGLAAWPAQPKLLPAVIVWKHGGTHVEVEGSFDNWTTRQQLQRSGARDFSIVKLLPPGVYQGPLACILRNKNMLRSATKGWYKFIVDGEWKYDPEQTAMFDEMGNVNNVLEVKEDVPEGFGTVSGFEQPQSPSSSYNNPPPVAEDYGKEPPGMPPHLHLTLLNVPPGLDSQAALPRPQHVILNHMYLQKSQHVNAVVMGITHRYKSKHVTTVIYKPKKRRRIGHLSHK